MNSICFHVVIVVWGWNLESKIKEKGKWIGIKRLWSLLIPLTEIFPKTHPPTAIHTHIHSPPFTHIHTDDNLSPAIPHASDSHPVFPPLWVAAVRQVPALLSPFSGESRLDLALIYVRKSPAPPIYPISSLNLELGFIIKCFPNLEFR